MQLYPHRARMKRWHYCKALFIKKNTAQVCGAHYYHSFYENKVESHCDSSSLWM